MSRGDGVYSFSMASEPNSPIEPASPTSPSPLFIQTGRSDQRPSLLRRSFAQAQAAVQTRLSRFATWLDKQFYDFGVLSGKAPSSIILCTVAVLVCFMLGLSTITFETDIYELWIEKDSRLHNERAFEKNYYGSLDSRWEYLFATSKVAKGNSILSAEALSDWHNVSLTITSEVSTTFRNQKYYWNDLCDRLPSGSPYVTLPCTKYTMLDCFQEGGFDYFLPAWLGIPDPFAPKPSFRGKSPSDLGYILKDSCSDWSGVPVPENFMYGGVSRLNSDSSNITSVASFQFILAIASPTEVARRLFSTDEPTQSQIDTATDVVLDYELNYINRLKAIAHSYKHIDLAFYASRSPDDILADASDANTLLTVVGYLIMFFFCSLAFYRPGSVDSRAIIGASAVGLVTLGVFSALGLSALFDIPFSPLHLQVLPFLALGLGTNDMFVLVFTFKFNPRKSVAEMTGKCLQECGASITLTGFINFLSFAIGGSMPLPNAASFSLSAALVVLVNYLIVLGAGPALLALNAQRVLRKLALGQSLTILPVESDAMKGTIPGLLSTMAASKKEPKKEEKKDDKKKEKEKAAPVPVNELPQLVTRKPRYDFDKPVDWFVEKFLLHKYTKISVVIATIVLFSVSIYGMTRLKVGLPLADIVANGSYQQDFLAIREEFYYDFQSSLITGMNPDGSLDEIDYPNKLAAIVDMQNRMEHVNYVNPNIPLSWISWVSVFSSWAATNHPANVTAEGYPVPEAFYPLLHEFLDTTLRGLSFKSSIIFDDHGKIATTQITFYQTRLSNDEDITEFIADSRKVTDASDVHVFPAGFLYNFYEQYMHVRAYFAMNMLYVTFAIGGFSIIFLYHPTAVLINIVSMGIIMIETIGFMAFMGMELNGVCVVNLVAAVGSVVQYTGYVAQVFMMQHGTNEERTIKSMKMLTVPIICGAVSTIVGVAPMGFTPYPYYTEYFFLFNILNIVLGVGNGIFLMPVILATFGPPAVNPPNPNAEKEEAKEKEAFIFLEHDDPRSTAEVAGKLTPKRGAEGPHSGDDAKPSSSDKHRPPTSEKLDATLTSVAVGNAIAEGQTPSLRSAVALSSVRTSSLSSETSSLNQHRPQPIRTGHSLSSLANRERGPTVTSVASDTSSTTSQYVICDPSPPAPAPIAAASPAAPFIYAAPSQLPPLVHPPQVPAGPSSLPHHAPSAPIRYPSPPKPRSDTAETAYIPCASGVSVIQAPRGSVTSLSGVDVENQLNSK